MKKALTFLAVVLFAATNLKAQEGEIIYVDNPSPDLLHPVVEPGYAMYDIDHDGTKDLWIGVPGYPWFHLCAYTFRDWQFYLDNYVNPLNQFVNPGDTLSTLPERCWRNAPEDPWIEYSIQLDPGENMDSVFIGLRKPVGEGYCYGWMRFSAIIDNAAPDNHSLVYIHDYAFCNDPNYPFRAGQTSFTWSTDENKMKSVASIYPNPANDVLFVETRRATSLQTANKYRITNVMGQTLMQGTIHGESQQINIEKLPAGIYFINVDEQILKFVKQ